MLSFSHRSPPVAALEPNRLSRAVEVRRAAGLDLLDLRQSNPSHGFPQTWLDSLTFQGSHYHPSSFGLLSTRTALSEHISCLFGGSIEAQDLLLGASTSEAYSLLFKLLCNAGDSVLAPSPSYPLLDALCRLESIELQEYPLFFEDRQWHIDFGQLEARLHPRCRAIVVIAPNNPTGSLPSRQECQRLAELAHSHQLAIIADEVFADFPIAPRHDAAPFPWALHCPAPLCFSLGGLSKSALLPQLKLAWTLVGGDPKVKHEAIERLEYIFDTYLSVSTPVQLALPSILQRASAQVEALRQRLRANELLLRRRSDP
ncbi:MAG: pyridoxal phosphate-dependent aminotransferase, partial [Myxococcota bacterium]|nr:pyridoxal phosphate-dependent aminotransferase [Myxococcota bacterium]